MSCRALVIMTVQLKMDTTTSAPMVALPSGVACLNAKTKAFAKNGLNGMSGIDTVMRLHNVQQTDMRPCDKQVTNRRKQESRKSPLCKCLAFRGGSARRRSADFQSAVSQSCTLRAVGVPAGNRVFPAGSRCSFPHH